MQLGPWAVMIGVPGRYSFVILQLKLLYQNLLHFIGRVYLLLDSGCSPVKSKTKKPLFLAKKNVGINFFFFTSVSPANASPWQPCHSPIDGGTKDKQSMWILKSEVRNVHFLFVHFI